MVTKLGIAARAVLIAGFVVAVSGCGSPASYRSRATLSPTAAERSPVQATLSWFSAVNHKDMTAAVAHFEPSAANQMDWLNGDTSTWPIFSALHCKPVGQSNSSATVYCTFSESQAPAVGNPDSFWTVDLQRQSDGRWLISGYGQG